MSYKKTAKSINASGAFPLPSAFMARNTLRVLSVNTQIHLACLECKWEDRVNPAQLLGVAALLKEPCARCGSKKRSIVQHLGYAKGKCLDCKHELSGPFIPWQGLRCSRCHSRNIDSDSMEVIPKFPAQFGDISNPLLMYKKENPWGINAFEDGDRLNKESAYAIKMFPDWQLHFLALAMFGSFLRESSQYPDRADTRFVLMAEANLLRESFKMTGDMEAGRRSIGLHSQAIGLCPDEISRAQCEHNLAIAINSMIAYHGEAAVAEATESPNIRYEAIYYAFSAAKVFAVEAERERKLDEASGRSPRTSKDLPPGTVTPAQQWARVWHLIGDLHKVSGNPVEVRKALELFDSALEVGLPTKMELGVRGSRAEAILRLKKPTAKQLKQAEADLVALKAGERRTLARRTDWMNHLHLARVYQLQGDKGRVIEQLEAGASHALYQNQLYLDEMLLGQRSSRLMDLFNQLAGEYLDRDRYIDALSAVETLRAATVRMHTEPSEEQAKRADGFRLALADHLLPDAARDVADFFEEDRASQNPVNPIAPIVDELLKQLTDVPTACITIALLGDPRRLEMVVFFCVQNVENDVKVLRWPVRDLSRPELAWNENLFFPGPFREERLAAFHRAASKFLFAPMELELRKLQVKRVILSQPARLSRFAFEALTGETGGYVLDQYDVCYAPSLALGRDLLPKVRASKVRNLLIVGYQGEDLTNAEPEIAALRDLFGLDINVLRDKSCNKRRVLTEMNRRYDAIHFVCHGTYDENAPLNSSLHFVPEVSDGSQALSALDIIEGAHLPVRPIVTLSACSSALMARDDINSCHGLVGALLRAGARCVIGSRWPVYDDTARSFMVSFYRKLRRSASYPHASFVDAQKELRVSGPIEDFAAFGYVGIP